MAESFDAVYENGVFKPVQPVHLLDGVRVRITLSPPEGPLTEDQVEAQFRLGSKVFEGLTDAEIAEVDANILANRSSLRPTDEGR